MKVKNMVSNNGNIVPNQFIITEGSHRSYFQSHDSLIVSIIHGDTLDVVYLDTNTWNYSRTTAKYRNQFLGETTKQTQAKIDSGEYILTDLN